MARRPRLYILGVAHHGIQRGNNRQACFGGESDYKAYLIYFKVKVTEKTGVPSHRVGDRKSEKFREEKINDSDPL